MSSNKRKCRKHKVNRDELLHITDDTFCLVEVEGNKERNLQVDGCNELTSKEACRCIWKKETGNNPRKERQETGKPKGSKNIFLQNFLSFHDDEFLPFLFFSYLFCSFLQVRRQKVAENLPWITGRHLKAQIWLTEKQLIPIWNFLLELRAEILNLCGPTFCPLWIYFLRNIKT